MRGLSFCKQAEHKRKAKSIFASFRFFLSPFLNVIKNENDPSSLF
jgi:hypothetical protein